MFIYNKNYSRNSRITGRLSKESKQINDRWVVMLDDESYLVQILSHSEEEMIINCDNTEIKIATYWKNGDKLFKATVNNVEIGVNIKSNNRSGGYLLQHSGSDVYAQVLSLRNAELYKFMPKLEKNAKPTELTSPITGKIIKFKVSEGDEVKALTSSPSETLNLIIFPVIGDVNSVGLAFFSNFGMNLYNSAFRSDKT